MMTTIFSFIRNNFKKIILSLLVFIAAVTVVVIIFFPINNIAAVYIDRAIISNNIPLKYTSIDVGYFGGKMTDVTYDNKINIDNVVIKYNPITLLLRKINFNIVSDLAIVEGRLNGSEVTAKGKISLANIATIFKLDASGSVEIEADYFTDNQTGAVTLTSSAVSFTHPLVTIEADTLKVVANINGQLLKFDEITATGKTNLSATGLINFNTQNINASILDINGKVDFMGINSDFSLNGSVAAPEFNLK